MNKKIAKREKRHNKIKVKIRANSKLPKLVVFKSNKYIYAQIIDNLKGKVLVFATEKNISKKGKKVENAYEVGLYLAKEAILKKINHIVFDRAGYPYLGRVKSLADGARKGGLKF